MKKELRVAHPIFHRRKALLKDIDSILSSGRLMNGRFTSLFEDNFADYCNSCYAVSVNSCTSALEITLRYIDVCGAEVIVPTNTFIATANAVVFAGARPVLADIKEGSYFLAPGEVEKRITQKTKAVIAVHIAGIIDPAIEEIKSICDRKGIVLIEDCAHALGSSYKGKMAGTFGLAGCFSFYPTKLITTAAGGMLITAEKKLAEYAKSARLHGAGRGLTEIVNMGNDWFLDEIRSAMGVSQLKSINLFIARRNKIAQYYDQLLKTTKLILRFEKSPLASCAYYKYPVQIAADVDIPEIKRIFQKKYGFELESAYWPTCHLQPLYKKMFGYKHGCFPVAESILGKQITLPIHANMTKKDACYAFKSVVSEIGK